MDVDNLLRNALDNPAHTELVRGTLVDLVKITRDHGVSDVLLGVELMTQGLAVLTSKDTQAAREDVMNMLSATAKQASVIVSQPGGHA